MNMVIKWWKFYIGGRKSNKYDLRNKARTQMNQISAYKFPSRYANK
jgi:hypothetical protein